MISDQVESTVEELGLDEHVAPETVSRFVTFALVGASGIVVDASVTAATIRIGVYYLLANFVGYAIAVSWNFGLNYLITWGRPDGSLARMYAQYVGADILLFGVRAITVWSLVDIVAIDPVSLLGVTLSSEIVASLLGIGLVAVATFHVAETVVFDGQEESTHE